MGDPGDPEPHHIRVPRHEGRICAGFKQQFAAPDETCGVGVMETVYGDPLVPLPLDPCLELMRKLWPLLTPPTSSQTHILIVHQ